MLRIVIAAPWLGDIGYEQGQAGQSATVVGASLEGPDDVRQSTADADAVIVTTHPMTADHIAALGPSVRIIGRAGIGLDTIDLEAARARGIAVLYTPDYCVDEVADHTVMAMLALVHRLDDQQLIARAPGWAGRDELRFPAFRELTVGIIGAGRIGRAVLMRLAPFGMRRIAFDPFAVELPEGVDTEPDLDRLLERSDLVSLHCPLTPNTQGLLSKHRIDRMKAGAYLVNVSRALLVDEAALAAALASGHLAGAAIDVFAPEPPSLSSPILWSPSVLATPHFAWHSTSAERRTRDQAITGVLDYLAGKAPPGAWMAVLPTPT